MQKRGRCSEGVRPDGPRGLRAFTLIEVLVVVAIIALLVAVLLPSLSEARDRAKLASCTANAKQIMTMVAMYQSENKDYVPVMFWYASAIKSDVEYDVPANNALFSVALRQQDAGAGKLPSYLKDPMNARDPWTWQQLQAYEDSPLLLDQYVCPFVRGQPSVWYPDPDISGEPPRPWHNIDDNYGSVKGPGEEIKPKLLEHEGKHESYGVVLGESSWPGPEYGNEDHPWLPTGKGGFLKYPFLKWEISYKVDDAGNPVGFNPPVGDDPGFELWPGAIKRGGGNKRKILDSPRRWSNADARRLRMASLSDCLTAFCMQGEWWRSMPGEKDGSIVNYKSHRTTRGSGTNAMFADTHIEWVSSHHMVLPGTGK